MIGGIFSEGQELKKSLKTYHLVVFGLLFVIPIAPFGIYGYLSEASGGFVPAVYAIACVAMIFTAFSYGVMAQAFPIAGSVYSYTQRGINPHVGFMTGWAILLDYILMPTLIYVVVGISMNAIFPELGPYLWGVIFIVGISILNVIGINSSAKVAMFALFLQMIIYITFVAFAIYAISNGTGGASFSPDPLYNAQNFKLALVMNAASIAVLSFLGFDAISTLVEEAKNQDKVVLKSCVSVLVLAGSLFIFLTYLAGCLWIHLGKGFENVDLAFYEISKIAGGEFLMKLTSFGTAFSWGGAALSAQLAVSRVLFAMSRDKNLPSFLGRLHKKYNTPYVAALCMAALSMVLSFFFASRVEDLTLLVNFGALTSFLMLHICVIYYYKGRMKSNSWFFHLVSPILGILIVGYVWLHLSWQIKLLGCLWLVIGGIYYYLMKNVFKREFKEFV